MGFIIDNEIEISTIKIGEEVKFIPNPLHKTIGVFYSNTKIGNLLDREGSIKFENPDLFCKKLFERGKWKFNFYVRGIYDNKSGNTFGEFDMNSLFSSTGVRKNKSLALINTNVVNSGKK